MTIYSIMQRSSIRSRDEQLVVARAQAYAMLELSQAGVLFLDREHKLMGEASAAAPELLGHTCATGTAFVQVIAELVDVTVRREAVAYLETLWKAEPASMVDATLNPLARVHSGSRHLALRFARLVVDGRVHHVIVSVERISAPRIVPHTIEVPALDEDTFAKRLAGETGTRPALKLDQAAPADSSTLETAPVEQQQVSSGPSAIPEVQQATPFTAEMEAAANAASSEHALGPLDVTEDSLPSVPKLVIPGPADTRSPTNEHFVLSLPEMDVGPVISEPATNLAGAEMAQHLATTITSPDTARAAAEPDPSSIIDPPDPRLSSVLKEVMQVEAARLENFLGEAREKAGQLRAILKLPAREPQAFREKLVLILELIRGINARAKRLPLPSVSERADRFEEALSSLRDKQTLSGNDFLPIAVKLDDLLSHLAIQSEVVARLREWRTQNGLSGPPSTADTQRSATMTGTTIRQPRLKTPGSDATTIAGPAP